MPAQQRLGLDKEPLALGPRQTAQPGEQRTICRSKRRPGDLPTKDRNLVTEDDDLDGQMGGVTPSKSQEFEHPDEADIEEGQAIVHRHRPGIRVATLLLRADG